MPNFPFFAPELLQPGHDVSKFDCGKPALNDFLRHHALESQRGGSARTFVVNSAKKTVVGYYSLTAAALDHEGVPVRIRMGQPANPIPAILMARFAIDSGLQGKGLGRALFRDALLRSLTITNDLGARAFLVDAKDDDALRFYARYNMMAAPDDPNRLFLLFKDIRKIIAR